MEHPIKIGKNVLATLQARVKKGAPDFSTAYGDLFIVADLPFAGIRLKPGISIDDYFAGLGEAVKQVRMTGTYIIPTGDPAIPIAVQGTLQVKDRETYAGNQKITILPQ